MTKSDLLDHLESKKEDTLPYSLEIEPDEYQLLLKMKFPSKNFSYDEKEGMLHFNRIIPALFTTTASYNLKLMELNKKFKPKHPIVRLWNKFQVSINHKLEFEGRSLYYGAFIKYDRRTTEESGKRKKRVKISKHNSSNEPECTNEQRNEKDS